MQLVIIYVMHTSRTLLYLSPLILSHFSLPPLSLSPSPLSLSPSPFSFSLSFLFLFLSPSPPKYLNTPLGILLTENHVVVIKIRELVHSVILSLTSISGQFYYVVVLKLRAGQEARWLKFYMY
uniref:Uncharacterized protein n=1 Tax=Cacopsylla melanoneura TaxID=428564 RepID=A0A8D8SDB6_9HEMI